MILIVWNVIITIILAFVFLRVTSWKNKWPFIQLQKDGIWFGYKCIDGSGQGTRIFPWWGGT